MENVAIVQPTPQLKSKDFGGRKTSQRLAQSPTRSANIEGKIFIFFSTNKNYMDINFYFNFSGEYLCFAKKNTRSTSVQRATWTNVTTTTKNSSSL